MLFHQDNTRNEVLFEGCIVRFKPASGEEINPGDLYLAERNTGVKLLTCQRHNLDAGCVFPVENAYVYDTCECRLVTHIDGEPI